MVVMTIFQREEIELLWQDVAISSSVFQENGHQEGNWIYFIKELDLRFNTAAFISKVLSYFLLLTCFEKYRSYLHKRKRYNLGKR